MRKILIGTAATALLMAGGTAIAQQIGGAGSMGGQMMQQQQPGSAGAGQMQGQSQANGGGDEGYGDMGGMMMRGGGGCGMGMMHGQSGMSPWMMHEMMHGRGEMGRHHGRGWHNGHGMLAPNKLAVMIAIVDTNGDRALQLDELQAVQARIFKYVDKNGDGSVTPDEIRDFVKGGGGMNGEDEDGPEMQPKQ